jgi:hypothetical protein
MNDLIPTELKSDIQETLASLYLRLNGYFTSGFIVHAPEDEAPRPNRTEIDVLAVRFPHNAEPEREICPSACLDVPSDCTDFVIAEVKGGKEPLQFNRGLRRPESLRSVLRWMGAFTESEIEGLIAALLPEMEPKELNVPDHFVSVQGPRETRIRAILFGVERGAPVRNQAKYIPGDELMKFIWACMRPDQLRTSCRTAYDFGLWGPLYVPLVRYFKDPGRQSPGSVSDLVAFVARLMQTE